MNLPQESQTMSDHDIECAQKLARTEITMYKYELDRLRKKVREARASRDMWRRKYAELEQSAIFKITMAFGGHQTLMAERVAKANQMAAAAGQHSRVVGLGSPMIGGKLLEPGLLPQLGEGQIRCRRCFTDMSEADFLNHTCGEAKRLS